MTRLDTRGLLEFVSRDWEAPARLSRAARASRSIPEKVALAIALYEAARATKPGWPDEATRRADLEAHLRVKRLLARAAHVGAR